MSNIHRLGTKLGTVKLRSSQGRVPYVIYLLSTRGEGQGRRYRRISETFFIMTIPDESKFFTLYIKINRGRGRLERDHYRPSMT